MMVIIEMRSLPIISLWSGPWSNITIFTEHITLGGPLGPLGGPLRPLGGPIRDLRGPNQAYLGLSSGPAGGTIRLFIGCPMVAFRGPPLGLLGGPSWALKGAHQALRKKPGKAKKGMVFVLEKGRKEENRIKGSFKDT
jgi:hypothetical protein